MVNSEGTDLQFLCLLTHATGSKVDPPIVISQSAFGFPVWSKSSNPVPSSLSLLHSQCESVSLGLYPLAGGRSEVFGSESVLLGAALCREAPVKRRKAPLQMRENQ